MANGLKSQLISRIDSVEKLLSNAEYARGYLDGLKEAEQIYSKKLQEYVKDRKALGGALRNQ